MFSKINLFLLLSAFNSALLFAQTPSVSYKGVQQTNAWVFYTGNHKLSEKFGLHTEYQWRRNDLFQSWMQSQIRLGLDYNFAKDMSTTAGYSFIDTWAYGLFAEETTPKYNHYRFAEHRVWEQFITKQKLGRIYTQNRFRLEQRWIENKTKDSLGVYVRDNEINSGDHAEPWKYRNRARYRYMIQIPLNHKEMVDNTLFIQASDEIFVNFGKGVKYNIFDQNRLYLALGWRFNHHCNLQLGYMNQFIQKSDGMHKENNHTLQVSITYNLDFTEMGKKDEKK